ncbi:MAG: hypothetical protein KatS3mg003_1063 [Candidatus Nitrosocaldaceae archaeon]|nr:MAG: hypothetical protein KatS3mg003_1063 [Candidatus Nitrosocaldaceae archaeon]
MTASITGMKNKLGIDSSNTDLDTQLTDFLNIATEITSNDIADLPSTISQTLKDHLIEFYACHLYSLTYKPEEAENFLNVYNTIYRKSYGTLNI